jgi:hypothetical protein
MIQYGPLEVHDTGHTLIFYLSDDHESADSDSGSN